MIQMNGILTAAIVGTTAESQEDWKALSTKVMWQTFNHYIFKIYLPVLIKYC